MSGERRRRDLNPRAATNDLLPFQGSPFNHLGTSASVPMPECEFLFSFLRVSFETCFAILSNKDGFVKRICETFFRLFSVRDKTGGLLDGASRWHADDCEFPVIPAE